MARDRDPESSTVEPEPTAELPRTGRPWTGRAPAASRDSDADTADPTWPGDAEPTAGRPRWGRALAFIIVVGLVAMLLFALRVVGGWIGWLPELSNPFAEQTTDRSQPVLLRSIQDLSRFTGASGNFEVVIDVEENRRFIPDVVFGERTLFVAAGSVDAYVEFGGLSGDAITVDEDNNTVEVRLPAAQLERPALDHDRSYVFAEQRGIINRLGELFGGDPNRQRQMYQLAETKIAEAAQASELTGRAQENAQKMLEGMLGSLGFTTVTVTFAEP